MRSRLFRCDASLLLAAILLLGACDRSSTEAEAMLPLGFAQRSDRPYISGDIIQRTDVSGETRLLVRVPRGTAARVREAQVTVISGALVRWVDGGLASTSDLRVGRRVTVWTTGVESRSLPPQVTGNGFLLARLPW